MYLYRRSGQNWTFVELFVVTARRHWETSSLCIRLCSGRPGPQFRRTSADTIYSCGLSDESCAKSNNLRMKRRKKRTRSQTVSAKLSSWFHSWFEQLFESLFEPGLQRVSVLPSLRIELHLTNPRSLKLSQFEPIISRIQTRPCRTLKSASKAASIKRDFYRSPRIFVGHMIAFMFSEQPMRQAAFWANGECIYRDLIRLTEP